jgi:tetratricopeptide (TPR) repeat protein
LRGEGVKFHVGLQAHRLNCDLARGREERKRGGMNVTRICPACGAGPCSFRCKCRLAFYCGPECQRNDWGRHKRECSVSLERRLQGLRRRRGEADASVAKGASRIGDIHFRQGRFSEAEASYREAKNICESLYGEEHSSTARLLVCLGRTMCKVGTKLEDAVESFQRSILFYRHYYGRDGTGVSGSSGMREALAGLGEAYVMQARWEEAIESLQEALDMPSQGENMEGAEWREGGGGEEGEEEVTMELLAKACLQAGQLSRSLEVHSMLTKRKRERYGDESKEVAASLGLEADALSEAGHLDESMARCEEALAIQHRGHGADKEAGVASCLCRMACLLERQGRLEESFSMHSKALKIRRAVLGARHADTGVSLSRVANALAALGRCEEALAMHEEALVVATCAEHEEAHEKMVAAEVRVAEIRDAIARTQIQSGDMLGALGNAQAADEIWRRLQHAAGVKRRAEETSRLLEMLEGA